jgi:hypothetical protein
MYFRTGMKGLLFMGVGVLLAAVSFLGMTIRDISLDSLRKGDSLYDPIYMFFLVFLGVGGVITTLGSVILTTRESGVWKEFGEKTTFRQRVTGNIPILKYEKPPPPAIGKRTGIIIGIIAMTLGSSIIIPYIVFKIPTVFMSFFMGAILAFVLGLLLVIFSIIYLDKDKKPPE